MRRRDTSTEPVSHVEAPGTIEDLRELVEQQIARCEALPPGAPAEDVEEALAAATADCEGAALFTLCPIFVPTTAAHITVFEFHEGAWTRARYPEHCAELHCACVDVDPAFAAFLRSGPIVGRVADAGRAFASTVAKSEAEVADEFTGRYLRALAAQLVGTELYEPQASILAVYLPAVQARLAACRARPAAEAMEGIRA